MNIRCLLCHRMFCKILQKNMKVEDNKCDRSDVVDEGAHKKSIIFMSDTVK